MVECLKRWGWNRSGTVCRGPGSSPSIYMVAYSLLELQSWGILMPSFALFGLPMVHKHAWKIDGNVLGPVLSIGS